MKSNLKGCSSKRPGEFNATKRNHLNDACSSALIGSLIIYHRQDRGHTTHRFDAALAESSPIGREEVDVTQVQPHLHANAAALHETSTKYVSFVLAAFPTDSLVS